MKELIPVQLNTGKPYHAPPIDIWGIGVILFTLLVGSTSLHLVYASVTNPDVIDTPWDEPTDRSPEYCRYLTHEIFRDAPWTKLSGPQLGAFLSSPIGD